MQTDEVMFLTEEDFAVFGATLSLTQQSTPSELSGGEGAREERERETETETETERDRERENKSKNSRHNTHFVVVLLTTKSLLG